MHDDFLLVFSSEIKRLRLVKSMTIEQLADLASVHRSTISLIESNKRIPTILVAKKISNALGIDLYKIIEYAEKRSNLSNETR